MKTPNLVLSLAFAALIGGAAGCGPKPALDTKTEAGQHANTMSQALEESKGDWNKVTPEHKKALVKDYGSEELAQEALEKMSAAKNLGNPADTPPQTQDPANPTGR